jgi:hypothetical protein
MMGQTDAKGTIALTQIALTQIVPLLATKVVLDVYGCDGVKLE